MNKLNRVHVRNQEFLLGGGGGSRPDRQKTICFFLVFNLFYSLQRGSNGFITEGGPAFSKRGVGGGGGGVQMLISIEIYITCDFPGGGFRTPYPPSGSAQAIA